MPTPEGERFKNTLHIQSLHISNQLPNSILFCWLYSTDKLTFRKSSAIKQNLIMEKFKNAMIGKFRNALEKNGRAAKQLAPLLQTYPNIVETLSTNDIPANMFIQAIQYVTNDQDKTGAIVFDTLGNPIETIEPTVAKQIILCKTEQNGTVKFTPLFVLDTDTAVYTLSANHPIIKSASEAIKNMPVEISSNQTTLVIPQTNTRIVNVQDIVIHPLENPLLIERFERMNISDMSPAHLIADLQSLIPHTPNITQIAAYIQNLSNERKTDGVFLGKTAIISATPIRNDYKEYLEAMRVFKSHSHHPFNKPAFTPDNEHGSLIDNDLSAVSHDFQNKDTRTTVVNNIDLSGLTETDMIDLCRTELSISQLQKAAEELGMSQIGTKISLCKRLKDNLKTIYSNIRSKPNTSTVECITNELSESPVDAVTYAHYSSSDSSTPTNYDFVRVLKNDHTKTIGWLHVGDTSNLDIVYTFDVDDYIATVRNLRKNDKCVIYPYLRDAPHIPIQGKVVSVIDEIIRIACHDHDRYYNLTDIVQNYFFVYPDTYEYQFSKAHLLNNNIAFLCKTQSNSIDIRTLIGMSIEEYIHHIEHLDPELLSEGHSSISNFLWKNFSKDWLELSSNEMERLKPHLLKWTTSTNNSTHVTYSYKKDDNEIRKFLTEVLETKHNISSHSHLQELMRVAMHTPHFPLRVYNNTIVHIQQQLSNVSDTLDNFCPKVRPTTPELPVIPSINTMKNIENFLQLRATIRAEYLKYAESTLYNRCAHLKNLNLDSDGIVSTRRNELTNQIDFVIAGRSDNEIHLSREYPNFKDDQHLIHEEQHLIGDLELSDITTIEYDQYISPIEFTEQPEPNLIKKISRALGLPPIVQSDVILIERSARLLMAFVTSTDSNDQFKVFRRVVSYSAVLVILLMLRDDVPNLKQSCAQFYSNRIEDLEKSTPKSTHASPNYYTACVIASVFGETNSKLANVQLVAATLLKLTNIYLSQNDSIYKRLRRAPNQTTFGLTEKYIKSSTSIPNPPTKTSSVHLSVSKSHTKTSSTVTASESSINTEADTLLSSIIEELKNDMNIDVGDFIEHVVQKETPIYPCSFGPEIATLIYQHGYDFFVDNAERIVNVYTISAARKLKHIDYTAAIANELQTLRNVCIALFFPDVQSPPESPFNKSSFAYDPVRSEAYDILKHRVVEAAMKRMVNISRTVHVDVISLQRRADELREANKQARLAEYADMDPSHRSIVKQLHDIVGIQVEQGLNDIRQEDEPSHLDVIGENPDDDDQ